MNKLIQKANQSRINAFLSGILFLFFALIVSILFATVIKGISGAINLKSLIGADNLTTLEGIAGFGGFIIASYIWVVFLEKRKFSSIGLEKENYLKKYFKGIFFGGIITIFIVVTTIMLYNKTNYLDSFKFSLKMIISLIPVTIFYIIQTASEEIMVRGVMMSALGRKLGILISVIISSILFMLLHISSPGITILAIINLFLAGALFGAIAYYYESLWFACGVHFIWNYLNTPILGVGVEADKFSFFKTNLEGPIVITGGKFSIEGGLLVTIIYATITVVLLYKTYQRDVFKKK